MAKNKGRKTVLKLSSIFSHVLSFPVFRYSRWLIIKTVVTQ